MKLKLLAAGHTSSLGGYAQASVASSGDARYGVKHENSGRTGRMRSESKGLPRLVQKAPGNAWTHLKLEYGWSTSGISLICR